MISRLVKEAVDQYAASSPADAVGKALDAISAKFGIPLPDLFKALPDGISTREPGFHASRAGYCHRQVVVEALNKGFVPIEVDYEAARLFTMGHLIHEWGHKALGKRIWKEEGKLWLIEPFRVRVLDDGNFRIVGTPDELVFELETMTLHIIDFKSANERNFKWKRKDGASNTHRLQLGTYGLHMMGMLRSSPLNGIVRAAGGTGVAIKHWVAYVNKNDLETCVPFAGDHLLFQDVVSYWNTVKRNWIAAMENAVVPPAEPLEGWQCAYCSLFDSAYKTTEARKDNAQHDCESTPAAVLLGLAPEEEEPSCHTLI